MMAAIRSSRAGTLFLGLFGRSAPLRFLIVGGLNTFACYLVYALLLYAGLPYPIANFGAMLFGIGLSFVTQGRIVFGDPDPRNIFRFVGSWIVIYLFQIGIITVLVRAGLGPFLAGLFVLPISAVTSYFVQKRLVFRAGRR